jgi:glyoxylase-like metal-dependent hydrolase (beta-lactamase superfamily II)
MSKRFNLVAVTAAMAVFGWMPGAEAQQRYFTGIAENLYWVQNNNHHAMVLVGTDGVILVDPIGADFSQWLRGEIERRFGVPVRYVAYSHHHDDHASGGAVFEDTATFVGHENMLGYLEMPPASTSLPGEAAELDSNGDGRLQANEASGDYEELFDLYDDDGDGVINGAEATRGPFSDVRAPDIVFRDRMTLTVGGAEAELIYVGRMAHANDMAIVVFPAQSTVFVVDFISLHRLPFQTMASGQLDAWLNAIRGVENLDVDIVAPSHGLMGTLDDVAAHRHYIEELRDEVAAGIARGASLAELQDQILMAPYQDWISYDSWRTLNIEGMYRMLTQ